MLRCALAMSWSMSRVWIADEDRYVPICAMDSAVAVAVASKSYDSTAIKMKSKRIRQLAKKSRARILEEKRGERVACEGECECVCVGSGRRDTRVLARTTPIGPEEWPK